MPFEKYAWNGVDVRGDDGLLHHGRVIDAVPEGLVVDFGGTRKPSAKLIPFGQLFHCTAPELNFLMEIFDMSEELDEMIKERAVEVLLRAKPDTPWKWYPGTLLIGDYYFGMFGLVNVTLPDGKNMQGIVYGGRIRARYTAEDLASLLVKKGTFSSKLLVVPRGHGAFRMPDDELMSIFNANMKQQTDVYNLMATHVVSSAHHGLFKQLAILGIFAKPKQSRSFSTKDLGWSDPIVCHNLDSEILLSNMNNDDIALKSIRHLFKKVPTPNGNINSLCGAIMLDVFEYLTPLQQTSLRGVCRKWESILTSSTIGRVFLFSQTDVWTRQCYAFAACMYNCFTQHTKMFIIHGKEAHHVLSGQLAGTACLLKRIMTERHVAALRTVLVVDKEWYLLSNISDWLTDLHVDLLSLTAVCDEVVLKNVTIDLNFHSCPNCRKRSLIIRIAKQRISGRFTADDLWAMLNNGLPDLKPGDMERLSEWIRHVSTSPTTDLWMVAEVIHMTQTSDPRDGITYRGMAFYPNGADRLDQVDAYQLTKLTLHVMLQRFKERGVKKIHLDIL